MFSEDHITVAITNIFRTALIRRDAFFSIHEQELRKYNRNVVIKLGLCKLENEILKEAKNFEKRTKMSF